MKTQQLKIVNYTEKFSAKNGNKYLVLGTDSEGAFSCWDETLFDKIKESKINGYGVIIEYTEKNNFKTVIGINILETVAAVTPNKNTSFAAAAGKDGEIRAAVALKATTDLIVAGKLPLENLKENVRFIYALLKEVASENG